MRPLAVLALLCLAAPLVAAPMVPTPVATAGMTDAPPAIDGAIDDACWSRSAAILRGFVETDASRLAGPRTQAWVCRDAERLYVAARCEEPSVRSLRADARDRDDPVWRDDCVELFIDANHDRQSFHHVIVNAIGTIYDDTTPGDASWNADVQAAARVGEEEWTVELSIALADLGGAPAPGGIWGFNIGRERHTTGGTELSVWSPTYGKFLVPERFGELLFAEQPGGFAWRLTDRPGFGPCELMLFGARGAAPKCTLTREWPAELERAWETPEPTVAPAPDAETPAAGLAHAWTARYRLVDGSEVGLVIEQAEGDCLVFRQAIPISISPEPGTALLAKQTLALESRVAGSPELDEELHELVADANAAIAEFVQGNLAREEPMPPQEWSGASATQQGLLARVAGLAYVVWTQSPLLGLDREQMPPTLQPDATIRLVACGNEVESGDLIITNLSEEPFEGRVTMGDLRLAGGEAVEATEEQSLLTNGDFSEDADADGVPDGWHVTGRDGSWGLEEQADGSTALVLSGQGQTTVVLRQRVDLEAGTRYTLIAEMSAQDLPGGSGFTHIINQGWTWSKSLSPLTPRSARDQYMVSFEAPESPLHQVILRLASAAGGTIRYHSVRLVEGGVEEVAFEPTCVTFHQAEYQELRVGRTVADPLPEMNEARVIRVAPGESRQIWLNLDTSALPPGDYVGSIRLQPFDREQPRKAVPLRLTVLPVRLPELMPIAVFNWDYARNERYVQDLVAHHNNTFLMNTYPRLEFDEEGNPRTEPDWSGYDRLLQVKLRHARERGGIVLFSYGIVRDFHRRYHERYGWELMSEPWRKAFRTWLLEFDRHMREDMGMDYDEYAVQLWDEATGHNAEMTAQAGGFVREVVPEMRLCMDGAQNPDEVRMLDPVIDLWIPHQSALYHRDWSEEVRQLYAEIAERGEPVWTYTCSTNMKSLDPLDYYRLKEWRVWDLGVQGSCFWAYNSWRGDPWDDFDGEIADCGTIYDGPGEPVTSRRWEATRDGREDYKALHLLREAGHEELADELVDEALADPSDLAAFEDVRSRLMDAVAAHCGSDPPELTAGPEFARADGALAVSWTTDRPTEGLLHYRVPGDARWRSRHFAAGEAHEASISDLPALRDVEWYLIWWDERGATGGDTSGLCREGWAATR